MVRKKKEEEEEETEELTYWEKIERWYNEEDLCIRLKFYFFGAYTEIEIPAWVVGLTFILALIFW